MENNEFKKVAIKNRTSYYFNGMIKIKYFDFDKKSIEWKIKRKCFDLCRFIQNFNWCKIFV